MAVSATQTIQETIETLDEPKRSKAFHEPFVAQFKKQGFTVMHHLKGQRSKT